MDALEWSTFERTTSDDDHLVDVVDLLAGHGTVRVASVDAGTLRLVQSSSTEPDDDFDTVPPMDAIALFEQCAELERALLKMDGSPLAASDGERRGWSTLTKTRVEDGPREQQLALTSAAPAWLEEHRAFQAKHGAGIAAWLETQDLGPRTVGEFRGGVVALWPPNGRTSIELMLYFRPAARGFIHEWTGDQRWGMAQALREVSGALKLELYHRGIDPSYTWEVAAAPECEATVRLSCDAALDDTPESFVERLRDHLGLG